MPVAHQIDKARDEQEGCPAPEDPGQRLDGLEDTTNFLRAAPR